MPVLDPVAYIAIFAALALGGTLKGATGMGAPVVAVPVIASFVDVRFAVILMVVPNFWTNVIQLWKYREHKLTGYFAITYAVAGGLGAMVGTVLLAHIPVEILTRVVAASVVAYIALRLLKPDFSIPLGPAKKLAFPIGVIGGVLQGSAGISAPISVSFLNAMRLDRLVFIPTISLFFIMMSVTQVPTLAYYELLSWKFAAFSTLALIPLLAFMPVGAWLARSISAKAFDRTVLVMLAVLAVKLIVDA